MCEQMRSDVYHFEELSKIFPGKFVSVRFEDLALNPMERAEHLYRDVGIKWSSEAIEFVNTHTQLQHETRLTKHPYSTFRNSREVAFRWLSSLQWDEIETIQHHCFDIMHKLGYKLISKEFYDSWSDFTTTDLLDEANE